MSVPFWTEARHADVEPTDTHQCNVVYDAPRRVRYRDVHIDLYIYIYIHIWIYGYVYVYI